MQMREKVEKSRNTVFFQWFVAPEGRKVGSLQRRVRSQLARWEMNNCTPLWREAHFQVKRYKTPGSRSTFGSWDVEKVHAVVARSTCRSEHVQYKTHHVWTTFGSWDVEKVHAVVARSTFQSQNVKKQQGFGPLLEVQMSLRFTTLHYTTLHSTTLHYTTLHNTTTTTTQLHSTTLHYTSLHSTTLHHTTLDR